MAVEANYELSVAYEVKAVSEAETPRAQATYKRLAERHEALMQVCEVAVADKGFDDTRLIERL